MANTILYQTIPGLGSDLCRSLTRLSISIVTWHFLRLTGLVTLPASVV